MAKTLPQCRQLTNLYLGDDPLGAAGAEALAAALPRCAALRVLSLERCELDEQTKKSLRQAWAQNGKPSNLLFL